MDRFGVYEPLCYYCLYGLGQNGLCTMEQDCNKCPVSDEYGTCFCVKEKPDNELTCPRFKYIYCEVKEDAQKQIL